jgi:hypothetical protein
MPDLHRHWESGTSVFGAIKALLKGKTLAVCLGMAQNVKFEED